MELVAARYSVSAARKTSHSRSNCADSFLGFSLFAGMSQKVFDAQCGFSCRLCANVDRSPFEPVPQPPDLHQIALLQGSAQLRQEMVHILEEEPNHLLE